MSWIEIDEAMVLSAMNSEELEGLRAASLGDGQADPLPVYIRQVTNLVRASVAGCDRNELGAGDTVPDELESVCLDLIIPRILNRLDQPVSDSRETARAEASKTLAAVRKCELRIQPPVTASVEDEGSAGSPQISAGTRQMTRESQDGI